jgi:hypothetical protein
LDYLLATGVDNIFPPPFELELMAHDSALRERISTLAENYFLSPSTVNRYESFHSMLVPKSSLYGYRLCTHLDLLTAVIYLACAIVAGSYLESARLPVTARRVFSYRFRPGAADVFDDQYGHEAFNAHVANKLDLNRRTVVVSADIADFFSNVVENRMLDNLRRCNTPDWLLRCLASLMREWRSQGGDGLPVGPHASFIFADAALLNVDSNLQADGVDFARYVDDYRLFAPNLATARYWLERLATELSSEGLRLNSAKSSCHTVNRNEYEALKTERRARKMWGDAFGSMAQNNPNPNTQPNNTNPSRPRIDNSNQQQRDEDKKRKENDYHSPFEELSAQPLQKRKKSQLNESDLALLNNVDLDQLLSKMQQFALTNLAVAPGEFCVFVEASCHRLEHFRLSALFEFMGCCPDCIPYLVDVLIEERELVPAPVRETATAWFLARLSLRAYVSEFELLQIARLLEHQGYRSPDSVFSFLQSIYPSCCPIVQRALLAALRGHCDEARAESLLTMFALANAFTRRAVVDLVWSDIPEKRRAVLLDVHRADYSSDPFLDAYATLA